MQSMGISMLSIGIQSFDDKYLKLLGRNYSSKNIETAFNLIKKFKFQNVNVDLIFAFPNQTQEELLQDITKVNRLGVDQITTYPLFTFPYSTIGKYMKIKKIKMPNFFTRRKFYKTIYNYFKKNNYEIASVWSFQKASEKQKYSSVTRNSYIGLGAGAGSRLETVFYFNTFSIDDYEKCLLEKSILPIAIDMPISTKLSNLYWFYWKLYETKFSFHDFQKKCDWKLKFLMKLFFLTGLYKKNNDKIQLTEKGAFWIHLAQNYFMLDYINKVWSKMKKESFPEKIEI
jgi:oxygen-independent coproporphyrinogen-3 oxidase